MNYSKHWWLVIPIRGSVGTQFYIDTVHHSVFGMQVELIFIKSNLITLLCPDRRTKRTRVDSDVASLSLPFSLQPLVAIGPLDSLHQLLSCHVSRSSASSPPPFSGAVPIIDIINLVPRQYIQMSSKESCHLHLVVASRRYSTLPLQTFLVITE